MNVPCLVLAAIVLLQDPAPRLTVGESKAKAWVVLGSMSAPDETELALRARRLERRWDEFRRLFVESRSERTMLRTFVVVQGRTFNGTLRSGPVGRYVVSLDTEVNEVHSEMLALGNAEELFTREIDALKQIQGAVDKLRDVLDLLERIQKRRVDVSEDLARDYSRRVAAALQIVDDLVPVSDLTASLQILRRIGIQLQEVRLIEPKDLPEKSKDDPVDQRRIFKEADTTIESLRKLLAGLGEILSLEIKLSTTLLLERLLFQAGEAERLLEPARASARAASKLAEAAPVPDKDLGRLLDLASDRQTAPADIREQLKQAGQALLLK